MARRAPASAGGVTRVRALSSTSALRFNDDIVSHPLSLTSSVRTRGASFAEIIRKKNNFEQDDFDEEMTSRRTIEIDKPIAQNADVRDRRSARANAFSGSTALNNRYSQDLQSNANLVSTLHKFFFSKRGVDWNVHYGTGVSGSPEIWNEEITPICKSKTSARLMIHPKSALRINWDIFMLFLLLVSMVVIPLDVAFFSARQNVFSTVMNVFCDLVYMIDLVLNFRTGVKVSKHPVEYSLDPWLVARRYLRRWFIVDLISAIPFNLVALALLPGRDFQATFKLVHLLKLINLFKLLRFSRLIGYWHGLQENYHDIRERQCSDLFVKARQADA